MLNAITVLTTLFLNLEDFLVTPIYFLLFLVILNFFAKNNLKSKVDRKYFMLAAAARMLGGISLGILYEFVFHGGDTSAYYHHGTKITNLIFDYPYIALKLYSNYKDYDFEVLQHVQSIQWHNAPNEFFIILISGFFGLFSFKIYSVMALFYSLFSFSGSWAMYKTLIKIYPTLKKQLAIATLFIPSVIFWGGGIMKDTICIGALGWLFWAFYRGLIEKRSIIFSVIFGSIMMWIIAAIKIYILIAFLPPALFWIFNENNARIKSKAIRLISKPLFLIMGIAVSIWGGFTITEGQGHYDIDNIAERTKINSEYLYAVSIMQEGSAYSIGEFDGTLSSIIEVIPQAINVALFRPYIFEVKNATMLLSAIEAAFFMFLTLLLIFKLGLGKFLNLIVTKPIVTFCITFTLILAAAVGMNSFNFGTLVRYKIPILPFYLSALYIMKFETEKYKKGKRVQVVRK